MVELTLPGTSQKNELIKPIGLHALTRFRDSFFWLTDRFSLQWFHVNQRLLLVPTEMHLARALLALSTQLIC